MKIYIKDILRGKMEQHITENYLSKQNTDALKGIFAICVLSHHLSQIVHIYDYSFVASIFQFMGYLSVAVFFFLSGYGLALSYDKKCNYIDGFPKNRILDFYIKYCLLILGYLIYYAISGVDVSAIKILKSFTFGQTVVAYGWYFQTTLILYILFYFTFKICKRRELQLVWFGIVLFAFCAILYLLGFSTIIIECVFCMLFGMFWYRNKEKIDSVIFNSKTKFVWFVLFFFAFCITLIFWNIVKIHIILKLLVKLLSAIFFVITVLFVANFVNIKNKLTNALGKYYFEIYAFHGMCINFWRYIIKIENDYVFILLAVASTLAFSAAIHPIFKLSSKIIKRG